MDNINDMVSEAMLKIDSYINKGKEKSFFEKSASKALAAVGAKDTFLNRWIAKRSKDASIEDINNSTINEISQKLIADIEQKRIEVIEAISKAMDVKQALYDNIIHYEYILDKAKQLLSETAENTKQYFNAQYLITMTTVSLEDVKSDLQSFIDPLIASANISGNQIQTILPTIESNLNSKLRFKTMQQKLMDLNEMTKAVSELSSNVGDAVKKDINEAIISSIEMLGNTGIDTDRLKANAEEQAKHQKRINETMQKTEAKLKQKFQEAQQIYLESEQTRQANTSLLIEKYSNTKN